MIRSCPVRHSTPFPAVFALIAGVSFLSVIPFLRLSRQAGASLLPPDRD